MKQLTVVAISTITYLKNVFPEDSYTVETFGGLKLRILKKKCRDELAQFVSTALMQAFEAFDKKYVSVYLTVIVIIMTISLLFLILLKITWLLA